VIIPRNWFRETGSTIDECWKILDRRGWRSAGESRSLVHRGRIPLSRDARLRPQTLARCQANVCLAGLLSSVEGLFKALRYYRNEVGIHKRFKAACDYPSLQIPSIQQVVHGSMNSLQRRFERNQRRKHECRPAVRPCYRMTQRRDPTRPALKMKAVTAPKLRRNDALRTPRRAW